MNAYTHCQSCRLRHIRQARSPVSCTNIATVVGWNTTTVDDNTKNHEAYAGGNLDHTDDELDLTIAPHTEILDTNQSEQERGDPSGVVDALGAWPIVDDIASSRYFEGQDSQPTDGVFPGASETPGGIDESTNVHGEGAVDWVHDGHFGKSLHHEIAGERSALKRLPVRFAKRTPEHL